MWRLRNLLRKIKSWLFIYRIGPLSTQYHQIKDPAERIAFAQENFGKGASLVVQEHDCLLRMDTEEAFNEG
jgi:hypothetical protein